MANTTTSIVAFSILSPDASLSYDRIKLRLEEYRALLASDSDTIQLSTENGKTVICRKQAKEMEQYLDQAEILLRDVVQSRDIPTLVVLHHLRDLSGVLDKLKLYDECRLTGNCALDLGEALGRRSLEFRREQAETLAVIAVLSVYQPRARTLCIQAVSISEEVVANDASHSNKLSFLTVLDLAGFLITDYLGAQWLERAIQLFEKELPPTMVHSDFRSVIYYNYGTSLLRLKQFADATAAYHESISIRRILVDNINAVRHNYHLAQALRGMGQALDDLGSYGGAVACYKEALDICTAMSAQEELQYNKLAANTLIDYGITLKHLNQFSEAAVVHQQAISLCRNLAQTGYECSQKLGDALQNYGLSCYSLGRHAESVLAYQESILLRRALAVTGAERENQIICLHYIAQCHCALGNHAEANVAANEALEMNHGRVLDDCSYAPDFKSCFVCQKATIPDLLSNASAPLPPIPSHHR